MTEVVSKKELTELLTKPELAEKLKISPRSLDIWVATGKIPYIKLSERIYRFIPDSVEKMLKKLEHRNGENQDD